MTNDLLIYGENICAFPYILGSPSSHMTLHPIPSEFIRGKFYQCTVRSEAKKGQQKGLFGAAAELKIFLLQNTYFIYAQIKDFQNFQISTHSDSLYIKKSVHLYDTQQHSY
jgi:hypothetical protein